MGCKMIKGNGLALLILVFIIASVPVSCENNSSINSTQSDLGGNATGLNPLSSDNISETEEVGSKGYFDIELTDHIVSIIGGILAILAFLLAGYFWMFPHERENKRKRIIGYFKKSDCIEKVKPIEKDHEPVPIISTTQNNVSNSIIKLPHPPNPNFTGRQDFLYSLAQSADEAVSRPKIFALVGNGGMGKTQIALQHAHDPKNDFKYVWWLRSEEPATLLEDYISIARDLHLPGWDLRDTDQTVKTVKFWLESGSDSRWLLVFDNAKEPKDLERYVPVAGNGQIIVTSRLSVWDGFAQLMEVGVFQRNKMEGESVDFLLKRTGKADRKGAADLASELGDLPLALEQAGAYIKESGISFADYLVRLKENRRELLSKGKPLNYPDSVATTWEISFLAVQKENPAAGDLLNLIAFLAPDAILRSLLEEGAKCIPEPLSPCLQNSQQLDDCISLLNRFSLIVAADNQISVHRLVQAVIQDRLSPEDQKIWAESALRMVYDAFSFDQYDQDTWKKCSKLSSHAFHASDHAKRLTVSPQETASLLNSLGMYLHNQTELASARVVLEKALTIAEQTINVEQTLVALIARNLGLVLHTQGDLEGSKRCIERALDIDEKAFGLEHSRVARDVNNLGGVLKAQGDLEGAKKCFARALDIDEKAFGSEHVPVAQDVNNLGGVMYALGDLEGARRCYERALDIAQQFFPPENTHIAICLNNLGSVLLAQGDLEGARKCFQRALDIDEKALGPDHTSVARDVNSLGSALKAQGDLEGARKCFQRALDIDEKALGPDHTSVAIRVNNLGSVLKAQGDLEGAKKCYQRALAIDEKALGPDHTSVAIRVNNLGSVLQAQGDLEGARRCAERGLSIFEKRLGKDHPKSVLVRNNLRKLQE